MGGCVRHGEFGGGFGRGGEAARLCSHGSGQVDAQRMAGGACEFRGFDGGGAAAATDVEDALTGFDGGGGEQCAAEGSEHAVEPVLKADPFDAGCAVPCFGLFGIGCCGFRIAHAGPLF